MSNVRHAWAGTGLVAAVLVVVTGAMVPASANNAPPINLPALVSTVQATYTPNVVIGPFPEDKTTQVWAYAPMNGVMYACGDFVQVKSADGNTTYDRDNLFAFDPNTGVVSDFAPDVNGPVYTCTPSTDGTSLYIGGAFTTVNGQPAQNIAKIDVATGALDPSFTASANGLVSELAVTHDRLLVAGRFTTISGAAQEALATVALDSGAFDPYMSMQISGQVASNSGVTRVYRFAISPDQSGGVALGNFTSVDGVSHEQAFRFALGDSSASLVDWDNPQFHQACGVGMPVWTTDVQFSPDGSFFVITATGGRPPGLCDSASRWSSDQTGSVEPTWVNQTCSDTLHSVAVTQKYVYVQGHQKCVEGPGGHEIPRVGIAALNAGKGSALSWRSDQSRRTGGKFLMITDSTLQPGFPSGLWAGCDCGPEGGVIFRAYP